MKIFAHDLRAGDIIRTERTGVSITGVNPDPDGQHLFIHMGRKSMRVHAAQIFDVERPN